MGSKNAGISKSLTPSSSSKSFICDHDDVKIEGLKPGIYFEREGTIGKGADYCDFHFRNGKYITR